MGPHWTFLAQVDAPQRRSRAPVAGEPCRAQWHLVDPEDWRATRRPATQRFTPVAARPRSTTASSIPICRYSSSSTGSRLIGWSLCPSHCEPPGSADGGVGDRRGCRSRRSVRAFSATARAPRSSVTAPGDTAPRSARNTTCGSRIPRSASKSPPRAGARKASTISRWRARSQSGTCGRSPHAAAGAARELVDIAGVGAAEPEPGLLHSIIRFAQRPQHSIRHCPQAGAVRLELCSEPILVAHR
jgi:hypothetical protein